MEVWLHLGKFYHHSRNYLLSSPRASTFPRIIDPSSFAKFQNSTCQVLVNQKNLVKSIKKFSHTQTHLCSNIKRYCALIIRMCRILLCRMLPDSGSPDTGQWKIRAGYRIITGYWIITGYRILIIATWMSDQT